MLKFDQNLSAIHAYLCADGYVIKNLVTQKHKYYYIGFRNTNIVLLKDFQNRFYTVFGVRPIIAKDGRCKIQNKHIFYLLTKEFCYYSDRWSMPNLSKTNLRYWLRAFFDCEAWVTIEKCKNRNIGLDSINRRGILQIQSSLRNFGISSKVKFIKNRGLYRLHIYGKCNLTKFNREICFLHPNKKVKLIEAIDSYSNYLWDFPDKSEDLKRFIADFIRKRTKIDKSYRVRICSKHRINLVLLSRHLKQIFGIDSKIYGPTLNGLGTTFFELAIHKKLEVLKLRKFFRISKHQL
jgi:intein/homing endonuclease